MLEGMRSFWNSVEVVGVVTRVFPMSCIQLSLLNIHQAIQPITTQVERQHAAPAGHHYLHWSTN